ncbi:MAG: hypothetical protein MHMPM18_004526 [Marteilia pararefringens]
MNKIDFDFEKIDLTALEENFLRYSSESDVNDMYMPFPMPLTPMQISSPLPSKLDKTTDNNQPDNLNTDADYQMSFNEPDLPGFDVPHHDEIPKIDQDYGNQGESVLIDKSLRSKGSSKKSRTILVDKTTEIRSSVMRMQINNPQFLVQTFDSTTMNHNVPNESSECAFDPQLFQIFNMNSYLKLKFNQEEKYFAEDQMNSSLLLRDMSKSFVENQSILPNMNLPPLKLEKTNDNIDQIDDFVMPNDSLIPDNDLLQDSNYSHQYNPDMQLYNEKKKLNEFIKSTGRTSCTFNELLSQITGKDKSVESSCTKIMAASLFTRLLDELSQNKNLRCEQKVPRGEMIIIPI